MTTRERTRRLSAPRYLELALHATRDRRSFLKYVLNDALNWPITDHLDSPEDICYSWSAAERRTDGLDRKRFAGQVRQFQPMQADQPWGIFLVEFSDPDAITARRGLTGPLRAVLRGLVRSRRQHSQSATWQREHLLFICTHQYQQFRVAYLKAPPDNARGGSLAVIGWGPDVPAQSACMFNLPMLVWPDAVTSDADWVAGWASAFNVEKLAKQFHKEFATFFAVIENAIAGENDFEDGKDLRMFTQTLMNRLMFLRFLECKAWLKFKGRTDYLRVLFNAGPLAGKSFYRGRLLPLFESLANAPLPDGHGSDADVRAATVRERGSRAFGEVPFLNAELFEARELDHRVKDVPYSALRLLIGNQGLFYRYHFTTEESTPFDIEVAVDPEMLGKVFEELVTGRHESGSYYTPRPVVSFMCREALKGFLASKTKASAKAIAALVDRAEVGGVSEAHGRQIVEALDSLKAVDPACGSGAYLLGLMHELVAIYRLLFNAELVKDRRSIYDLKLGIISHNLYGVDTDPVATNIAMLRMWLSLELEADEPRPLPDLDFKIATGDSLLGPDPRQNLATHGNGGIDWRATFADVFVENDGFDIVLANPPYVRKEKIPADAKPILRENFADAITGRSDLYCSFYARGVQLLRPGGMHIFICSSAWLDADYGSKLQAFLLRHCRVHAIYDSAIEKQFSTANVNTIVSVLQKSSAEMGDCKFVLFQAPFERAVVDANVCVETILEQQALTKLGSSAGAYVGAKWGGLLLRAPISYKEVFVNHADAFAPLSTIAAISGYVHDNNTGGNFGKKTVLWSLRDAKAIAVSLGSAGVREIGVKAAGNSREFAPILFARTFGSRHLIPWCAEGVLGKEFYKVSPHDPSRTESIVAQLNSTLGVLQRELLGIKGLGGGALKFAANDVGQFLVIPDLPRDLVVPLLNEISAREIRDFPEELQMPDRQALDNFIFDCLGIPSSGRRQLYADVLRLLDSRRKKARTIASTRLSP